jgi:hypothetical protein
MNVPGVYTSGTFDNEVVDTVIIQVKGSNGTSYVTLTLHGDGFTFGANAQYDIQNSAGTYLVQNSAYTAGDLFSFISNSSTIGVYRNSAFVTSVSYVSGIRYSLSSSATAGNGVSLATSYAMTNVYMYPSGSAGTTANVLGFATSGVERMRITSGGLVGIATTAPRAGLGSAIALDVSGCVYGRLPVTVYTSSNALDLNTNFATYSNSYIYLTNPAFAAVTLPTATATTLGGTFFQLKNSTPSYMSIAITNTLGLVTPVVIGPSNAITFVISPTTADRMLLF